MRWKDIFVAGSGAYYPRRVETAEAAIEAGRYSERERAEAGIRSVRTAEADEAPTVMAADAARLAVTRSAGAAEDIGLVLYACMGHQGRDMWTPAHYVMREIAASGLAVEVRQGSNGGLAAVELAAAHIAARDGSQSAIVTTGDAFHLPFIDRWRTENQQVFGDAATAMVLSNGPGFARLLATASESAPELEPVYRGSEGWTRAPCVDGPVDLRARTREYLLADPFRYDQMIETVAAKVKLVVERALDDAGAAMSDIALVLHPSIGETIVEFTYYEQLGITRDRTLYDWAVDYGHLGAGDQLAAFNELAERGQVNEGELVLAIGAGIGYSWTAAVFEVTCRPEYARNT